MSTLTELHVRSLDWAGSEKAQNQAWVPAFRVYCLLGEALRKVRITVSKKVCFCSVLRQPQEAMQHLHCRSADTTCCRNLPTGFASRSCHTTARWGSKCMSERRRDLDKSKGRTRCQQRASGSSVNVAKHQLQPASIRRVKAVLQPDVLLVSRLLITAGLGHAVLEQGGTGLRGIINRLFGLATGKRVLLQRVPS